jgi:hypothetical protein
LRPRMGSQLIFLASEDGIPIYVFLRLRMGSELMFFLFLGLMMGSELMILRLGTGSELTNVFASASNVNVKVNVNILART